MEFIIKRERVKNFIGLKVSDTTFAQMKELAKKNTATISEVCRAAINIGLKKLAKVKN